jgi:uncharacterized protein YbaR (Trm112 family)
MAFDFQKLENILVCPATRTALVQDGDRLVCVEPNCRLSYPIADDIPIMLVDEATELSQDEWRAVMERSDRDSGTGEKRDNGKSATAETNSGDG